MFKDLRKESSRACITIELKSPFSLNPFLPRVWNNSESKSVGTVGEESIKKASL